MMLQPVNALGPAFVAFSFVIALFALAFFALWIYLCVWVYRDANKRGMDGALWLIIVIFTHLLGAIIYLLVRKPTTTAAWQQPTAVNPSGYCTYCGAPLPADAKFCHRCGKPRAA